MLFRSDLPEHLIFQESAAATAADRSRQTWMSERRRGSRTWELVVEKRAGTVHATLTGRAADSANGNGKSVWTTAGGWEPFGTNRLEPETAQRDVPPLIVTAP